MPKEVGDWKYDARYLFQNKKNFPPLLRSMKGTHTRFQRTVSRKYKRAQLKTNCIPIYREN